jgi:hypothetical protein
LKPFAEQSCMTSNLRNNNRVKTKLDCIFGVTEDTPRSGTVTSLSLAGCFVKTKVWATNAPRMHIRLWLETKRDWLRLQGTVLYHLDHIGFGLLFKDLSSEDESILKTLVEQSLKPAPETTDEENHTE